MSKTYSRRDFLKGTAAGALGMAMAGVNGGILVSASEPIYTAGTYSASAKGISSDVTVTMTFDETSILEVVIDASGETESIGGAAVDELQAAILEAQSAEIDGVSGATITSNAVKEAAASCIDQAKGLVAAESTEGTAEEAADAAESESAESTMEEWLGEAPEISDDEISEEISADVIVIGGGLAGVAAVKAVVDEGGSVIMFEKCETVQGRSAQFGVVNSELVLAQYDVKVEDPSEIIAELMKESGYMADYRTLKYWADHSGEAFDWYVSSTSDWEYMTNGLVTEPEGMYMRPERYPNPANWSIDEEYYPCYQITVDFSNSVALPNLYEDACNNGEVDGRFYTRAVKLLTDDSGRVTGCIAHNDEEDTYIKATAAKGVVLATGDYSGDSKMLHYYCPETDGLMKMYTSFDINGDSANTGDGHKMGMWVGAAMERTPHAPVAHNMGSGSMGATPFLYLNTKGERFMNESVPGQQLEDQIEQQPGKMIWQIFDANWSEQIPYMPCDHGCACYVGGEVLTDGTTVDGSWGHYNNVATQDQIDSDIENGGTFTADTLEELFAQIDIDAETALASVERYNELAEQGVDEDFGKLSKRLFPVNQAPFYASKITTTTLLVCIGGLKSDADCHVYTDDDEIIPGLYVAGNVQGGRMNVQYPTTVPGISHSLALTFGRHAGANCYNEI